VIIDRLKSMLQDQFTPIDREWIQKAYAYAEKAYAGQQRTSGESFLNHCTAVATILMELNVTPVMVVGGLLHDLPHCPGFSIQDIRREFGEEAAGIIEGVLNLSNLPMISRAEIFLESGEAASDRESLGNAPLDGTRVQIRRHETTNEGLRKMFLAMGEDVRVVVVKLADRLHNMRTLGSFPEAEWVPFAQQTLDIFAPLANRLGIWQIKWELEDLSFRYLNPEKYREISEKLAEKREDRERQIVAIIHKLHKLLNEAGITAQITGRPKHIYSIYRKMVDKGKPFEMVRDLRGVRVLVADVSTCYMVLGIIHNHWRPIPNEFDDYIALPKENNYQSLHTAVIYDDNKPLEVQIRTHAMNENAEFGIAAHWKYKEHGRGDTVYDQRVNWIRRLMEWRQELADTQNVSDGMRGDIFQNRVYVFTPRGDIIDLPAGSTPIDFAYHVHTEIGHRCRGARINGKLVSLDYHLQTGDQVEILTSRQGGPSRDWLNTNLGLVHTSRARAKIRAWFIHQDREHNLQQGKAMLERELRRLDLMPFDAERLARLLDYRSVDDFYIGIGCGNLSMGRVISQISELAPEIDDTLVPKPLPISTDKMTGITVTGMKGLLTNIAQCCTPAPGDPIIGYITRGRGATIHRNDCPNAQSLRERNPDRIIQVSWGEPERTYSVEIQIKAYDRMGMMADLSAILDSEGINLRDIKMNTSHNLVNFHMQVDIKDIAQLSRVLVRLENIPNVMEAHRVKPG